MNLKKIISVLILIITLFSNISPVMAVTFEEGKTIKLQKDHDCISLLKIKGQDILKGVTYVMYYNSETNEKQPAFCVEPEKEGIGTGAGDSYDVTLSMLEDEALWRILFKGYMGSKYEKWGLETDDDLYYATKTAVHCLVQNISPVDKYEIPNRVGWGENISLEDVQRRGKKVLEVAQELYEYGLNGNEKYMEPEVSINKNGEIINETINGKKYLVQKYLISGNREISTYNISIENFPDGTKIFNNKNEEVNKTNEHSFKIAVPEEKITLNIEGKINITDVKIKSYPVFYARAYDENKQDYITYASVYDEVSTSTTLNINAYRSGLKIYKIDEETGKKLSGVVFNVKYTDTNENIGNFTTDEQGKIEINGLRQGNITVTEIKTKDQYILKTEPINVALKYNEIKEITVENSTKKGQIKVIKIDAEDKEIKIPGVEFTLYNSDKEEIGKYVTDENGEIKIENLKVGTYYLKESKENAKYCPLEEEIKVEVKWNETTEKIIENEKKKGQVKVIKIDEDYNEIKLEGVKFEVIDSNEKVVETLVTDKNGEATTSMLPIGKYRIREISTQENYILDEKNITVEIKWNEVTEQVVTNKHKVGNLKIYKVDADNHKIALGGIVFDLYSEEFEKVVGTYITDSNGEINIENLRTGNYKLIEKQTNEWYDLGNSVDIKIEWDTTINEIIENELKKGSIKIIKVDSENNEIKIAGAIFEVLDDEGRVLETITTNESGEAITLKYSVRDYESLTIREVATNQDYVLNDQPITIKLQAHQIQEIIVPNSKKKGRIKVIKVDSKNNEIKLSGVKFEIYNKNNELVETLITDKNGEAISKELLCKDEYTIKEVETQEYYILNEATQTVTLQQDEIKEVIFENEAVEIKVKIEKEGVLETEAGKNISYDFKNIRNNSNVSLDDFVWTDILPTDAIRADRLLTGTWNEDLTYSVWYKTNKNDFKCIKEGLSTQVNNEIKFKELQLDEDEYITEYQLRFGTVKVGFSEVEAPKLYCDVLENLDNGYKFTNKTKVSGSYKERDTSDEDEWTTIVYNKEPEKEELPRTGY